MQDKKLLFQCFWCLHNHWDTVTTSNHSDSLLTITLVSVRWPRWQLFKAPSLCLPAAAQLWTQTKQQLSGNIHRTNIQYNIECLVYSQPSEPSRFECRQAEEKQGHPEVPPETFHPRGPLGLQGKNPNTGSVTVTSDLHVTSQRWQRSSTGKRVDWFNYCLNRESFVVRHCVSTHPFKCFSCRSKDGMKNI